jgi:hypothetical protein
MKRYLRGLYNNTNYTVDSKILKEILLYMPFFVFKKASKRDN